MLEKWYVYIIKNPITNSHNFFLELLNKYPIQFISIYIVVIITLVIAGKTQT